MKKYLFLLFLIFSFNLFAQTYSIPEPKRPKEIDVEKAKAAAEKDETSETESEFKNTIKYGWNSVSSTHIIKILILQFLWLAFQFLHLFGL